MTRKLLKIQLPSIGIEPTDNILEPLAILLEELYRWNSAINLTAINSPQEAVEKHIIDSLTLLPFLPREIKLLDAGSGAGFPGLPLKICRPDITVFSVEASKKKVYFQREVIRRLKLQNFLPLPVRLENLRSSHPELPLVDVVVSRALGSTTDLAQTTSGYLKGGGYLIVMKGAAGNREAMDWQEKDSGLFLEDIHELNLPVSGAARKILVFRKRHF
ncbi:MAG: 16S rRNA (guanine(527)-N(7))-methyltransferase RsmG [Desulfuromonadaceae bacterium]|nr:16S rRNA (guanine(527)-N(7))-methyltransferase RsmG [Desulfuromonadaceae bacterium]